MRPRISIRGSVRPSVGPSDGPSVHPSRCRQKQGKSKFSSKIFSWNEVEQVFIATAKRRYGPKDPYT